MLRPCQRRRREVLACWIRRGPVVVTRAHTIDRGIARLDAGWKSLLGPSARIQRSFCSGESGEGGGGGRGGVSSSRSHQPTRRRTRLTRRAGVTPPPVCAKTISPGMRITTPRQIRPMPHRRLFTRLSPRRREGTSAASRTPCKSGPTSRSSGSVRVPAVPLGLMSGGNVGRRAPPGGSGYRRLRRRDQPTSPGINSDSPPQVRIRIGSRRGRPESRRSMSP
jgi:hypothetical protein